MNFLNLITGETIMANSNFASIDPNQPATQRQVYGVACHFASIHAKSPSERYGLTKVFHAIIQTKILLCPILMFQNGGAGLNKYLR